MRIKTCLIVTALLISSVGSSIGYAVSVNPRVMRATSFTVTPVGTLTLTPIPSGSLVPSGGPANPAGTTIPTFVENQERTLCNISGIKDNGVNLVSKNQFTLDIYFKHAVNYKYEIYTSRARAEITFSH